MYKLNNYKQLTFQNLIQINEPKSFEKENNFQKQQSYGVGIDLGTTYSLCSVIDLKNPPTLNNIKIIKLEENSYLLPSAVAFRDNETLVGKKALDSKCSNLCTSTKINISKIFAPKNTKDYTIGTQALTTATEILKNIKQKLEFFCQEEIKTVTITVPAKFNEGGRQATKIAAVNAGFEVLRIINEPTAAALFYDSNINNTNTRRTYMVYDLGGGTFDCSILSTKNQVYKTLSSYGDGSLGGDDLDNILMDLIIKKAHTISPEEFDNLKFFVKKAKEQLTTKDKIIVKLENQNIEIAKNEFEKAITPLINKTIDLCLSSFRESKAIKLDYILMVGGSSRIPIIHKILHEKFKNVLIKTDTNPDLAVVNGATLQSYNIMNKNKSLLIDATPLSIGIETLDGIKETIIPRNTSIPCEKFDFFTTHVDNQNAIDFHVVQGEGEFVKNCFSIDRFTLKNLPARPAGMLKIKLSFKVDNDSLLHIEAFEENTSNKINITTKTKLSNLNQEEIKNNITQALINGKIDMAKKLWLSNCQKTHSNIECLKSFEHKDNVLTTSAKKIMDYDFDFDNNLTTEKLLKLNEMIKNLIKINKKISLLIVEQSSSALVGEKII